MITQTFLNTLKNNLDKELLFEYAPDKFVNANYHITEIKNLTIDSVDCGGKINAWKETVVQLWENPLEIGKSGYLKTTKAVEIFDRVDSIKPLFLNSPIKIEYGNKSFHTAHLIPRSIVENDKSIIVKLHADATQCKATVQNTCCSSKNKETEDSITNESAICC